MPENIDWSLYNLSGTWNTVVFCVYGRLIFLFVLDPAHFSKIAIPGPLLLSDATTQKPTPSELQNFVRQAADNIFGDFKPYVPPPDPDGEDEEDVEAANEQRLAELVNVGRIKQLPKKPAVPSRRRIPSGLRLRHETDAVILGSKGDLESKSSIGSPTDKCTISLFIPLHSDSLT